MSYVVWNFLVNSVSEVSHPRQLQLKHLILDLVMHHVDDLGGFLHQVSAGQLLHLQLLQLSLGVTLGLASSTAPVTIADTTGVKTVEFCSSLLVKIIIDD